MLQLENSSRKIDTVFIVSLFVMFAITAILLILIGARQYRFTADSMNRNYEIRTASSYLTEKVHQSIQSPVYRLSIFLLVLHLH